MLNANIFLTPLKKYSIGFNTELTHSNIRQLGVSGKLSFLNRNIFKGSEILKFSVQGSFLDSKDAADNEKLLNAWAFYDWANSVYTLTIASAIFPIFYGSLFAKNINTIEIIFK